MRAAARRRAFARRTRELRAPFLELHGCDLLCIFLFFFAKRETRRTRPRHAVAQQKTRRGIPPGPSGAISLNTFFWKILVTRVKRNNAWVRRQRPKRSAP
jgi:hypothetical protein